jgi:RimJ/RimL family protein N-acetyltransferase
MKVLLSDDVILLRPLVVADVEGNYRHWFNDPAVNRFNSHGRFPMMPERLVKYVTDSELNPSLLVLAVELREGGVHVGNISLQIISWIDRNAEMAFLMGETAHQGEGIMARAGRLLIDHAFGALNLHRVYCGTPVTNEGMMKLAVKLGMKKEGLRKEAIFKAGQYIDIVEYGLINPNKILH